MWKCKHCSQEFNFERKTEKANHSRHCLKRPDRDQMYKNLRQATALRFDASHGPITTFEVICGTCSDTFSVKERLFLHPQKEQYFCSRSCSNSVGGSTKARIYFPDDSARYRTIAFRHHEKKCVVCGEQNIVAIHHVNENHDDNDPQNLIPLCPTHHQYMHSQYKSMIQQIVDDYIQQKWACS